MQLAAKLVLVFLICLSLVVAVFSVISVRQVDALVMDEQEQHALDLADMLRSALHDRPRAVDDIQQVLTFWSSQTQRLSVRLVKPGSTDENLRPRVPEELIVSRTEVISVWHRPASGEERLFTYVPLGDTQELQLEVAANDDYWNKRLPRVLTVSAWALGTVGTVSSLAIMLGGWWLLGRPLRKLVDKVEQIGAGDLSQSIDLRRRDELGQLASAVNSMCEQLADQRERIYEETRKRVAAVEGLRHEDRLRTVGRLAAGLAHEIGTPLNVISGRAELIAGGKLATDNAERSAEIIKSESQRIAGIVRQLLDFARRSPMRRSRCDLNQVVRQSVELMRPLAKKRDAELIVVGYEGLAFTDGDPAQLQQVLTNLIINAVQALPDVNGKISVSVLHRTSVQPPADADAETRDYWLVQVEDNGQGIAEEAIDHVFEPFFTTKDVGEGTGLGLSLAYGIIQEHGGWITVASRPGGGTTFEVFLPCEAIGSNS